VLILPVTPEPTASFDAAAEAAPAEQSAIAIVTPATSLPFVPRGSTMEDAQRGSLPRGRTLRRAGDDRAAGTIHTE
jgi:hypothetical protein